MLANHCRSKKYNVKILDCEAERLDYISSAKKLTIITQDLPALLYMANNLLLPHKIWKELLLHEELKEINPSIKTIFVGGHVSALPRETLENEKSIDIIALNEGVYAISNLLKVENLNDDNYLKK